MPFIPTALALGSAGFGVATGASSAAILTDVALAGLGMTMAGQYQSGREAKAQAESQAAWNEYNAQLAEREAAEAQEAAAYEEKKFRKGGERLKARQRALYAKSGVVISEGSPLEKMEETASELEMEALNIRRTGQLGYQRYTAQAGLERMMGKSALLKGRARRRASYWRMGATGLSGTADILREL